MLSKIKIVCIGNRLMGDDGAGCIVADILENEGWKVFRASSPLEAMHIVAGADEVIIIDAIYSGSEPGRILMIDSLDRLSEYCCSLSTHGIDLLSMLKMLEALGMLPKKLKIYGIEGKSFKRLQEPSEEVLKACKELARIISELLLKEHQKT